jgi:hypothetical protein
MNMSIHASALVLLAVVPCSLSAQMPNWGGELEPYPCLPFEPENTIEWPTSGYGDPSAFGRLVIADLDGDDAPEGVVTAGGLAVVLWRAAVYDAPQRIEFPWDPAPTSVADLAVLPDGGLNDKDGILMTDERGLFLVTYENGVFPDPTPIAGSAWEKATPIHVDDLDGDHDMDIIGISANRRSILICKAVGEGFQQQPSVSVPIDASDVVALDWNADGTIRELAVLSARWVRIFTTSGTLLHSIPYVSLRGCIARFRAADVAGGELLAWTRLKSSGKSELAVYGQNLSEVPQELTFALCEIPTDIEPVAILAGDYDGDANGNDELLLVHEANRTAIVLANLGTGPQHFDVDNPSKYDVVPLSADVESPGGVGIPAFAQLDPEGLDDDDNPDDLVFPVSATAKIQVYLSLPFYRAQAGQPLTSADIFMPEMEYDPGAVGGLDDGLLKLAIQVPPRYLDFDQVELIVWQQTDTAAPGQISATAMSYASHSLVDTELGTHQWFEVLNPFPDGDCCVNPYPCYYTELRFVKTTVSPVAKSRIFTGGFRLRDCGPDNDYSYLTDQGIPNRDFGLYEFTVLSGVYLPEHLLGIYVPMSSQPPFPDGIRPDPGSAEPDTGDGAETY